MSPVSAAVFSAFGGLWVVFAILSQRSPTPIWCVVPVVISALLAAWSISVSRTRGQPSPQHRKRLNKLVAYASAFEGVALLVGLNILDYMRIADQALPLLALIVGLHFLPFARYIPDRRYYPLALALIGIGIAGALVPSPDIRAWFVGLSSALVLWVASIVAVRVRTPPG